MILWYNVVTQDYWLGGDSPPGNIENWALQTLNWPNTMPLPGPAYPVESTFEEEEEDNGPLLSVVEEPISVTTTLNNIQQSDIIANSVWATDPPSIPLPAEIQPNQTQEDGMLKNITERRYDNAHDVYMRLDQTICRYEKIPVKVYGLPNSLNVKLVELANGKTFKNVDSSDPALNISSPPLGYCNSFTTENLVFVSRMPLRMQKQGLCPTHARSIFETNPNKSSGNFKNLFLQERSGINVKDPELACTILDKFPSLKTALGLFEKHKILPGVAFDRSLALVRTDKPTIFRLKYKTNTIGLYLSDENQGLLTEKYKNPFFEEILNPFMKTDVDGYGLSKSYD